MFSGIGPWNTGPVDLRAASSGKRGQKEARSLVCWPVSVSGVDLLATKGATTSGSMCRRQIAVGNSWTCECEESPARSATAGAPWLYEAMGVHGFLNFERACALPRILCFRNRLSHMLSGTCPHLRRAARPGRTPRAKIKKQLRDGHSTHCGEEHLVSVALPRGQCHAAFQTYLTCDDMMYTGME